MGEDKQEGEDQKEGIITWSEPKIPQEGVDNHYSGSRTLIFSAPPYGEESILDCLV